MQWIWWWWLKNILNVWYNNINYYIGKCICKKYSSNTLPHVSRPNWSINVVAGRPLGCLPCFGSQRSCWETVSFVATKLHPRFSLTSPLAFFPGYLNTWNRLLSPILWRIWVSQLKRNGFKSAGGCSYAPSPHALQRKDRRKCNFQHSGHQWDTGFLTFYRDCYFMKNTRVKNKICRSCFFLPFKSDHCESYIPFIDGINRQFSEALQVLVDRW